MSTALLTINYAITITTLADGKPPLLYPNIMFSHFDYHPDVFSQLTPILNNSFCRLKVNKALINSNEDNKKFDCEIIGPFPLLHINHKKILSKKSPAKVTLQFGWRVLVVVDDQPVLTVDYDLDDGTLHTHLILSGFSALNLYKALEFVEKRGQKNNWKANLHQIKIIDLPDLAESCLWITHSAKGFLPYSTSKTITKGIILHSWNEFASSICAKNNYTNI